MPVIKLNQDGSVSGTRSKEEIIAYYNGLIERRACAMRKLEALGGDPACLRNRIIELNNEKKRKLTEG